MGRIKRNRNSWQESGSSFAGSLVSIGDVASNRNAREGSAPRRYTVWATIALLAGMIAGADAPIAMGAEKLPGTMVVVYADRKIPDHQWEELFRALHRDLPDAFAEAPGIGMNAQMMRGDQVKPGIEVGETIVVYLHGDCALEPLARRGAYGVRLGWVRAEQGQIAPFVHVDCTAIGQELGAVATGNSRNARETMMAGAVARVILHEWIHIANQNAGHGRKGLSKPEFGVDDLIPREANSIAQRASSR